MKKVFIILGIIMTMISFIGCKDKGDEETNIKERVYNTSKNEIGHKEEIGKEDIQESKTLKINTNQDSEFCSGMPIIMTPTLDGEYKEEVQYHWIVKNENDFEGFSVPEKGPQKEIINDGQPVELGLFAEVCWIEGFVTRFSVELRVEERYTGKIIDVCQVNIENCAGVYKVENIQ